MASIDDSLIEAIERDLTRERQAAGLLTSSWNRLKEFNANPNLTVPNETITKLTEAKAGIQEAVTEINQVVMDSLDSEVGNP